MTRCADFFVRAWKQASQLSPVKGESAHKPNTLHVRAPAPWVHGSACAEVLSDALGLMEQRVNFRRLLFALGCEIRELLPEPIESNDASAPGSHHNTAAEPRGFELEGAPVKNDVGAQRMLAFANDRSPLPAKERASKGVVIF